MVRSPRGTPQSTRRRAPNAPSTTCDRSAGGRGERRRATRTTPGAAVRFAPRGSGSRCPPRATPVERVSSQERASWIAWSRTASRCAGRPAGRGYRGPWPRPRTGRGPRTPARSRWRTCRPMQVCGASRRSPVQGACPGGEARRCHTQARAWEGIAANDGTSADRAGRQAAGPAPSVEGQGADTSFGSRR